MTRADIIRIVRDRVRFWVPVVGIQDWSITVQFDEAQHKATAVASPEYLTLVINFNVGRMQEQDLSEKEVSEIVLHELCHALTWTLARGLKDEGPSDWVSHHEEMATSAVTRAIWRAKYGKEAP